MGSIVLAAALLGLPRALDARAFGAHASVYVEVAPQDPELLGFAGQLALAIDRSALTLASRSADATVVVELLGVSRSERPGGRRMEAARFALHDGSATRPLILHYPPGQHGRAAERLLESLVTGERGM